MDIADILSIAEHVITAAAALAALTPTPRDNAVLRAVRKVVDFLAFNWGGAANRH